MKKSKLLKSLVALAVSIVAAIGCISLVACGGGEAVNSVKLNKTSVTLQVNGVETLIATTDPAGATVTWSSSDSAKVEVDATGKLTAKAVTATPVVITAKAGDKSATCNVTVEEAAPAWPKTNEFSYDALKATIEIDPPTGYNPEAPDSTELKKGYFTGVNAFLTLNKESSSNKLRGKNASGGNASTTCIEIKDGALSVTFEGAGTLAIGFCSTGSDATKNISGLAVKNAAGTCLEGTFDETATLKPTLITAEADTANNGFNAGFYQIGGSTAVVVTFNITEAGTYTIWGGIYEKKDDPENAGAYLPNNKRATRIYSVKMVDNGPQA